MQVGEETNKPLYGLYIIDSTSQNNLITNNYLYQSGVTAAICDDGVDTNFGADNRVNDGS